MKEKNTKEFLISREVVIFLLNSENLVNSENSVNSENLVNPLNFSEINILRTLRIIENQ